MDGDALETKLLLTYIIPDDYSFYISKSTTRFSPRH